MNLCRTIRFLTLLLSASVLGIFGGCGSAGSCDTFAADYCARVAECEPATYAFLSGGDDTICQARLRPTCNQATGADGVNLTPEKAGECGKAIRSATCDELLGGRLPATCTPPGTRADGAACSDNLQCTSTRCTGSATMCGTCVPRLKAGEPCQSLDQCQYGLRCKTTSGSTGTCVAYIEVGQPCGIGDTCLPSLFCDNGGQPSGVCATRRNLGETCLRNGDCDGQKKLVCDNTSKKCITYTVSYVDVGGACPNNTTGQYNVCKRDAHCMTSAGTGGGTSSCIAAVSAGQPCNNVSATCAAGLVCTNSVCQSSPTPLACK